jgi:C-terminal processing protease CtpA/Prc
MVLMKRRPFEGATTGAVGLGLVLVLGSLAAPAAAAGQTTGEEVTVVRLQRLVPAGGSASDAGWVGIRLRLDMTQGPTGPVSETVQVTGVVEGSPAEAAGVRTGDVVLHIGGVAAGAALRQGALARLRPGDRVRMGLRRDDGMHILSVQAAEAPRETQAVAVRFLERARLEEQVARLRADSLRMVVSTQLDSIRTELLRIRAVEGSPPTVVIRSRADGAEGVSTPQGMLARVPPLPSVSEAPVSRPFAVVRPERPVTPPAGVLVYTMGQRAVLGAEVVPVNPGLGSYFGVAAGLLVTDVIEGTPGHAGGLRSGDVIVRAGGVDVATVPSLRERVEISSRGGVLDLVVVREGNRRALRIPTS